jgi:hypothetical protein
MVFILFYFDIKRIDFHCILHRTLNLFLCFSEEEGEAGRSKFPVRQEREAGRSRFAVRQEQDGAEDGTGSSKARLA